MPDSDPKQSVWQQSSGWEKFGIVVTGLVALGFVVIMILFIWAVVKSGGDSFAGSGKNTMFLFHSPSCGFCVKLKPEWEKFTQMAQNQVNIRTVDVSKPQNQQIASEYGVRGVPHIVKEKNGERILYQGNRDAHSMHMFAVA